jgi:hypothetical protein
MEEVKNQKKNQKNYLKKIVTLSTIRMSGQTLFA